MKKVIYIIALVSALGFSNLSHANERDDTSLWLARICAHEATWEGIETNDCAALYEVLSTRAEVRGTSFRRELMIYSRRFYHGVSTRPWARYLTRAHVEAGTPRGWPETWPSFRSHADRWRRLLERTDRIVSGQEEPVCDLAPWHWGARTGVDRARAEAAIRRGHWVRCHCGNTLNAFFTLATDRD